MAIAHTRQSKKSSTAFIVIRFFYVEGIAKVMPVPGGFLNKYDSQD